MKKRIYFDYETTTPVDPRVKREMERFWSKDFGNPSSIHKEGVTAKTALDSARKNMALILNCKPEELIFTSGGTESNNLAIFGCINKLIENGARYSDLHLIASSIEHSSVLEVFKELEKLGAKVDFVGVNKEGIIKLSELQTKMRHNTTLVSVIYANNEIGTIQPIHKISNLIKDVTARSGGKSAKPIFHVDASQAPLYLDINRDKLGADMITIDGQKIYGPKGIGLLYKSKNVDIKPILFGGGQERGLRPGTENIPLMVGFASALAIASVNRKKETARLIKLRDYFISSLQKMFIGIIINGSLTERLPNNINFSYPGLDAEFAVLKLDAYGIACSTKSACMEGEEDSYVIKALRRDEFSAKSTLRFSLGRATTKEEIDSTLKSLKRILDGVDSTS